MKKKIKKAKFSYFLKFRAPIHRYQDLDHVYRYKK